MYAIVRTGGKQQRVEEGRSVTVERLPAEEGATVELGDVLMIADDGEVTIGTPLIDGARVMAQVEAHGRAKKIIVFKYKAKVRTRKKTGHRQAYTQLVVREILRPGQESKTVEKPRRRRRRKATKETAAEAATQALATAEVEAPAPRRRTRTTAAKAGAAAAAPKRRARKPAAKAESATKAKKPAAEASTPKRRTRGKATEAGSAEAKKTTTGRRSPRKKTEETE